MKQTAVEWIENEILNSDLKMKLEIGLKLFALIKQAKEIERQQIIEAHGDKLKKSRDIGNYEYWFTGKDYYNQTFKNTEK
jgi:hypothetical protein